MSQCRFCKVSNLIWENIATGAEADSPRWVLLSPERTRHTCLISDMYADIRRAGFSSADQERFRGHIMTVVRSLIRNGPFEVDDFNELPVGFRDRWRARQTAQAVEAARVTSIPLATTGTDWTGVIGFSNPESTNATSYSPTPFQQAAVEFQALGNRPADRIGSAGFTQAIQSFFPEVTDISPPLSGEFIFRGNFSTSNGYQPLDVVQYTDNYYVFVRSIEANRFVVFTASSDIINTLSSSPCTWIPICKANPGNSDLLKDRLLAQLIREKPVNIRQETQQRAIRV